VCLVHGCGNVETTQATLTFWNSAEEDLGGNMLQGPLIFTAHHWLEGFLADLLYLENSSHRVV